MSLITLLNPLHRSAMMNLYLLSTSVCESIPVRRGCVIAYTIVYLPERDIFTIYTGDAHSPAARKTRRTQNQSHTHNRIFLCWSSLQCRTTVWRGPDILHIYICILDWWYNNRLNEEKSRYRAQFNLNYLLNCLLYYLWLSLRSGIWLIATIIYILEYSN